MWFSPGILVGGMIVTVYFVKTENVPAWLLITCLVGGSIIDLLCRIRPVDVPVLKTDTIYVRDDDTSV